MIQYPTGFDGNGVMSTATNAHRAASILNASYEVITATTTANKPKFISTKFYNRLSGIVSIGLWWCLTLVYA